MKYIERWFCCLSQPERNVLTSCYVNWQLNGLQYINAPIIRNPFGVSSGVKSRINRREAFVTLFDLSLTVIPDTDPPVPIYVPNNVGMWLDGLPFMQSIAATCPDGCDKIWFLP